MSDKKDTSIDKLIVEYMAQSIHIEAYRNFFGTLPNSLLDQIEKIATAGLDDSKDLMNVNELVEWRANVAVKVAAASRKARNDLLKEYGYDEDSLSEAVMTVQGLDDDSEPPKGRLN